METQAQQPPRWGGIRAGPALAGLLYVLLVASAALALWVREFPNRFPRGLGTAAPFVFLAFVAVFAAYRLAVVRAGKYPAFKAFFQIGAATLFFMLLLPSSKGAFRTQGDDLAELLRDPNPKVRAVAAEVAPHRPDPQKYGSLLAQALKDPDRRVREEAHRSLVRIAGEDLGGADDDRAVKAWGDRFR